VGVEETSPDARSLLGSAVTLEALGLAAECFLAEAAVGLVAQIRCEHRERVSRFVEVLAQHACVGHAGDRCFAAMRVSIEQALVEFGRTIVAAAAARARGSAEKRGGIWSRR